ncbi:hypothetical protein KR009_008530 [Drosophila setifemur]|nr:hypothetical protein KR009_008530 [Drosophila setifemur]
MDNRVSTAESEQLENPTINHEERRQDNVAKFFATIGNISRNIRKDDATYLQRHPEIRAIIRVIITEAIKAKPSNIFDFTASLFHADNDQNLVEMINKQLKWVNEQLRDGNWNQADGVYNFSESSDDTSERDSKCPAPTSNLKESHRLVSETISNLICPENFKPSCK